MSVLPVRSTRYDTQSENGRGILKSRHDIPRHCLVDLDMSVQPPANNSTPPTRQRQRCNCLLMIAQQLQRSRCNQIQHRNRVLRRCQYCRARAQRQHTFHRARMFKTHDRPVRPRTGIPQPHRLIVAPAHDQASRLAGHPPTRTHVVGMAQKRRRALRTRQVPQPHRLVV